MRQHIPHAAKVPVQMLPRLCAAAPCCHVHGRQPAVMGQAQRILEPMLHVPAPKIGILHLHLLRQVLHTQSVPGREQASPAHLHANSRNSKACWMMEYAPMRPISGYYSCAHACRECHQQQAGPFYSLCEDEQAEFALDLNALDSTTCLCA